MNNNNLENADKTHTISEMMPSLRCFQGKTVVVKYGGSALQTHEMRQKIIGNVVLLSKMGIKTVVVHGGGLAISDMLKKIGKRSLFVDGLRYTDNETMDIVQMVLCGLVGKQIVQLIGEQGYKAISLSGMDGRVVVARKLESDKDLGLVGDITSVNLEPINHLLAGGYIPVISSVACGEQVGEVFNVNADTAAARVAGALKAEKLILLTDVCGIMSDTGDDSSVIPSISLSDVQDLLNKNVISGGMIPKINCCVDAIHDGVAKVHIVNGLAPNSILEVFLNGEIGTSVAK